MRDGGVDTFVATDRDMVADHETGPSDLPDHPLDHHVEDAPGVGTGAMIPAPTGRADNFTVEHREHGHPERRILVHRPHHSSAKLRPGGFYGIGDDIDRVRLPIGAHTVAGYL